MSSTNTQTYYNFQLNFTGSGVQNGGTYMTVSGITDSDAAAIEANWKGFAWPASMGTVSVSVLKQEQITTDYTTDYQSTPITFT